MNNHTSSKSSYLWLIGLLMISAFICMGFMAFLVLTTGFFLGQSTTITMNRPSQKIIPTAEPYNQITFIGNDGNVWVTTVDGSQQRQLTTDGQNYRQPTWSPDNSHLAFIGDDEASGETQLFIAPVENGPATVVYSETQSSPFYLYWSPNSQSITFLTQDSPTMSMRQLWLDKPTSHQIVAQGSPFYWVWSPYGDRLLMHVGGDSKKAHVSFVYPTDPNEPFDLDIKPGRFQPPDWSADGNYIYYAIADGQRKGILYQAEADAPENRTKVTRFKGPAFFVLSPDGQHIFYTQMLRRNTPPFGTAYLVGVDGKNEGKITDHPVASGYWSPDGKKLALLTLGRVTDEEPQAKAAGLASPLPEETVHRWWIYHVETETLEVLRSFEPTSHFNDTVQYFDQYHHSLTFWSPDSRYFLVIDKDSDDNNNGQIWLVDTTFVEEPKQIAEGTMANWSWR